MKLQTAVLALALLGLASTSPLRPKEHCDFHDENLERAIFQFLGKLRSQRPQTYKVDEVVDGVTVVDVRFDGLNSLRPFGPFFTFCENGSKIVQFDLVNEGSFHIIASLRAPDGRLFAINYTSILVRLTSQFTVEGSGENVQIYPRENLPVSRVGLSVHVDGLDDDSNKSIVESTTINDQNEMWDDFIVRDLKALFQEILYK